MDMVTRGLVEQRLEGLFWLVAQERVWERLTWLLSERSGCSLRCMQACLDLFKRMWYTVVRQSRGAIWVVDGGESGM
jgi:hypothetical protein